MPLTVARGVGAGATIVILPSAFGVAPDLEAQMLELAADAILVVAVDPFFRDDPGPVPYADMARVMKRLGGLDRARTYRDLRAAIAWTRSSIPSFRGARSTRSAPRAYRERCVVPGAIGSPAGSSSEAT